MSPATDAGMPVSGDAAARRAPVSVSEGPSAREAENGAQIATGPLSPFDIEHWHVVLATEKRIECADGCDGPDPHIHEYRAGDENPNRPPAAPTGVANA